MFWFFAQKKESYDEKPGGGKGGQPNDASSSNPVPSARDGLYDKTTIAEKQILPYEHLREADVFWQKRVWRVIDTRQKMNHTFTYSKQPFIAVLLDIVQKHPDASVFMDDEFTMPTTYAEISKQIGGAVSV